MDCIKKKWIYEIKNLLRDIYIIYIYIYIYIYIDN